MSLSRQGKAAATKRQQSRDEKSCRACRKRSRKTWLPPLRLAFHRGLLPGIRRAAGLPRPFGSDDVPNYLPGLPSHLFAGESLIPDA